MSILLFCITLICFIGICFPEYSSPLVKYAGNNHWYQIVIPDKPMWKFTVSYYASIRRLSTLDNYGYLATINDVNEANFLYGTFFSQPVHNGTTVTTAYLGGSKEYYQDWIWPLSGSVQSSAPKFYYYDGRGCVTGMYCNWAPGEPPITLNALCMQVNFAGGSLPAGSWISISCWTESNAYIVEYDPTNGCDDGFAYTATSYPVCVDIDECALNPNICGAGYACKNVAYTYQCVDVNECLLNMHNCVGYQACVNTDGSYECKGSQ